MEEFKVRKRRGFTSIGVRLGEKFYNLTAMLIDLQSQLEINITLVNFDTIYLNCKEFFTNVSTNSCN